MNYFFLKNLLASKKKRKGKWKKKLFNVTIRINPRRFDNLPNVSQTVNVTSELRPRENVENLPLFPCFVEENGNADKKSGVL